MMPILGAEVYEYGGFQTEALMEWGSIRGPLRGDIGICSRPRKIEWFLLEFSIQPKFRSITDSFFPTCKKRSSHARPL